jgi:hypothetical protein
MPSPPQFVKSDPAALLIYCRRGSVGVDLQADLDLACLCQPLPALWRQGTAAPTAAYYGYPQ